MSQSRDWEAWRDAKIRTARALAAREPVVLDSLAHPAAEAVAELERRCALGNFALYRVARPEARADEASAALVGFARRFGLVVSESHRSAGRDGVVALRTSSDEGKKGYIPYTPKAMNWHTDGYYNPSNAPIQGFILHCHRQASQGGANQLLDPEIAYLRLREANPDFVGALMHPRAMTIPENREPDGTLRPASVGPVFFPDRATGRLQMRYTARTRSIEWRDDPTTRAAANWLREMLLSGDPLMCQVQLKRGQGILNNNVLHNRTGFVDGPAEDETRVILRVRFHARVAEEIHGSA